MLSAALLSPGPVGSGLTPGLCVTKVFVISTSEPARAGRELRGGAGSPWEVRQWCHHPFPGPLEAEMSLRLQAQAQNPHLQGEKLPETMRN